jgi:hypothetical protein
LIPRIIILSPYKTQAALVGFLGDHYFGEEAGSRCQSLEALSMLRRRAKTNWQLGIEGLQGFERMTR